MIAFLVAGSICASVFGVWFSIFDRIRGVVKMIALWCR